MSRPTPQVDEATRRYRYDAIFVLDPRLNVALPAHEATSVGALRVIFGNHLAGSWT